MKTLIIGDIHGCLSELHDLIDKAGIANDDQIIALGDVVDRGPDTPQVLEFFTGVPSRTSLMGNHERKHIRGARHEVRLAPSQIIAREQFGDSYPQTLQLFIDLPEAVLVHGYLEPGIALEQQRDTVLCGTRTGENFLQDRYAQPWYMLYEGVKPVIVGHHDYLHNGQPAIFRDLIYCLDTSCVHGRVLTSLLLPEFKIVAIPSHRNYWREILRQYAPPKPPRQRNAPIPPSDWNEESEQTLAKLTELAVVESQRISQELQARPGFSELTPRQQAKVFAACAAEAGKIPVWPVLLNLARQGKIHPDAARKLFKSSGAVKSLLARINGAQQPQ